MQKILRQNCRVVLLAFLLFGLSACKELPDEAKTVLSYTATSAKERAASWEWVRPWVAAKDPAQSVAATEYCIKHAENLNAQAKGLADLVAAVQIGSKLSQQARTQLSEQANTAKASCENFTAASKSLAVKPGAPKTWEEFSAGHQAGLDGLMQALVKVSSLVPPKEAKQPKVKPVSTP